MTHQHRSLSLAWWALPPLFLQCIALNGNALLTWPTWALVLCALFKLWECRRPFDRRLVALLQLLSAGLLAAQLQSLWASCLQLLAVLLALAGLLGHELAGALTFRGVLQRSLQLLAAALPSTLVLFLFVPRQGESFPRLCRRAARMHRDLATLLEAMADQQQLLAHAPLTASQRRHHQRQWRQLRSRLAQLL